MNNYNDVNRNTIERYNKRIEKLWICPESLWWDNQKNQDIRFKSFTKLVNLQWLNILDLGCWIWDFKDFLQRYNTKIKSYKGVDINEKLIDFAKNKFSDSEFEVKNILETPIKNNYDFIISFWVINFNLKWNWIDNYEFCFDLMKEAFDKCNIWIAFNMIVNIENESYPREDFIHYYDYNKIIQFIRQHLSSTFVLNTNIPAIPQREATIIVYKN